MKRGVKRVTLSDKMVGETRQDSYYANWATRLAHAVQDKLATGWNNHCVCITPCAKWPVCKPKVTLNE
jgi:hypothetical protein